MNLWIVLIVATAIPALILVALAFVLTARWISLILDHDQRLRRQRRAGVVSITCGDRKGNERSGRTSSADSRTNS
ncbi:MAG: hypothetical protein ABI680_10980 [Chthoniobacteraceae bacterium]